MKIYIHNSKIFLQKLNRKNGVLKDSLINGILQLVMSSPIKEAFDVVLLVMDWVVKNAHYESNKFVPC